MKNMFRKLHEPVLNLTTETKSSSPLGKLPHPPFFSPKKYCGKYKPISTTLSFICVYTYIFIHLVPTTMSCKMHFDYSAPLREGQAQERDREKTIPVSYTHLTLPTKLSV